MAEEERRTRAPPRKAKKNPDEAPLFLQKTYQMVDTSPQDIVGWTETGETFVVKNLEEFCNLLPTFYKHKNFRSFVRQLNFYGFRKLRADSAMTSKRPDGWWEFRHEKFLKGHPEMLVQIKRADHYEEEGKAQSDKGGGSDSLKGEVKTLQGRIQEMAGTIEQLTGLVDALLLERATGVVNSRIPSTITSAKEALSKKRKVVGDLVAPMSADIKKTFDDVPRGLEGDEARLLSQLSLDSADPVVISQKSAEDRAFPAFEKSAEDRAFPAFDFTDSDDAALKPVSSMSRSAASDTLSHPFLVDILQKLVGEGPSPSEPHLSETKQMMRVSSIKAMVTA